MGRTKGSKNKTTNKAKNEVVDDVDIEQVNTEVEDLEEQDEQDVEEDDVDDEDVDDAEPTRQVAPGMTRVADPETIKSSGSELLDAIREQTAALTASMPPRRVLFSKFKTRSPFNPTGRKRKMKFIVFQNGYRCNPKTLTDVEVDIINSGKIRSGQYIEKIVTVRIDKAASPEDSDKIFLSYNNKTPDQRMMVKDHWRNFSDLLQQIVAEGEAKTLRMKQRRQLEAR